MNWWPEAFPCRVTSQWSTTCVMCLLFCRCWQCGALQQPGGYPQVDHHLPKQPQFDYEAELALVAQFQEQFHELDQALTALQPLPGPPAQPTRTPVRLFNRFALLDLESGVQQEQEVIEVQVLSSARSQKLLDTPDMPQFDTLNKDLLKAWCKHKNIRGVSSKSKNELRDMCLLKLRKKVEAPRHM
ncbi:hypothetical protein QJQ45_026999 [Haematococcus lacustris]|nr:hypothetical protein QJQ45_026999 [Haematococcus lacustris]